MQLIKFLINYMIPFLGILLLSSSCKKSSLMTYNGEHLLYFSTESVDSININFSMLGDDINDTTISIPVNLMGALLNTPAPFFIGINSSETTLEKDKDFAFTEQNTFPANKHTDTIKVKFNRTPKLETKEYVLQLELQNSAQFNMALFHQTTTKKESRKVRFFITDILNPTKNWLDPSNPLGTAYYLGTFSKKKFQLLVVLFHRNYVPREAAEIYELIDYYPSIFGGLLNNYLKEQEKAGTPVLDGDGTLMKAGPAYQ